MLRRGRPTGTTLWPTGYLHETYASFFKATCRYMMPNLMILCTYVFSHCSSERGALGSLKKPCWTQAHLPVGHGAPASFTQRGENIRLRDTPQQAAALPVVPTHPACILTREGASSWTLTMLRRCLSRALIPVLLVAMRSPAAASLWRGM